jgi:hypothetical protein
MAIIQNRAPAMALPRLSRRVLYIGPAADEVCAIVTQHVGEIDIRYESDVRAALVVARQSRFDTVIVDQRDESLATRLIVPLISGIGYDIKLVVVSGLKDVSQYLTVPGVARVLTAPIREGQLLRVLGLNSKPKHFNDAPKSHRPVTAKRQGFVAGLVHGFFSQLMAVVSALYKRAAFVLLLTLFVAFAFYALLIGYFLLSSSWGAPMTLSRGHELVNKVEKELTELRVALGKIDQELTENAMDKLRAERDLHDAQLLIKYSLGTVEKEIKASTRQRKTLAGNVKRMEKVRDVLDAQLTKGGMSEDLEALYKKRLIDKKTFNASALGLVEASQRLAAIDGEVELMKSQLENMAANDDMLKSLKLGLETGGPISSMSSASSDLLLLVKQSVDAKAAYDLAKSGLESGVVKVRQLKQSEAVLKLQIAALENSALARAISERVDVVFVPYANLGNFQPGTPIYSCLFTVFMCQQSGFVGDAQPGEFSSVHPFFGKPIRGVFVEAKITKPIAATREIIHGTRAPFFF